MTKRWHAELDGNEWEKRCHTLLGIKHRADYQPIGDKGGDWGLDGLVESQGIVYQAYGQEAENKNPLNGIKSKISSDLGKLAKNRSEILALLGKTKVKRWILLLNRDIPHSSLHHFAKTKEDEIRSLQLEFIAPDFQVILQTPQYLETENFEYEKRRDDRIEIYTKKPILPPAESLKNNEKFIKILDKFKKVITAEQAEEIAYDHIKDYIENSILLDEIQKQEPEFYSAIEEIRSDVEKRHPKAT